MTGLLLIIYLFNYVETKARYLFMFVQRAYTDLHNNTRGARGEGVADIVIISDDGQLDSRT